MKFGIILFLLLFITNLTAQSQDELINKGIKLYNSGKYVEAEKVFSKALRNYSLTHKNYDYAETTYDDINITREEAYNESADTYYADLSKKEYTNTEQAKYVQTEIGKYMDAPLKYSGKELADIYFYRGKTNLVIRRYAQALSDFSKVLELNPSYSEAYLTRSITNHLSGSGEEICSDLEKASQSGNSSAKIIADHLCK